MPPYEQVVLYLGRTETGVVLKRLRSDLHPHAWAVDGMLVAILLALLGRTAEVMDNASLALAVVGAMAAGAFAIIPAEVERRQVRREEDRLREFRRSTLRSVARRSRELLLEHQTYEDLEGQMTRMQNPEKIFPPSLDTSVGAVLGRGPEALDTAPPLMVRVVPMSLRGLTERLATAVGPYDGSLSTNAQAALAMVFEVATRAADQGDAAARIHGVLHDKAQPMSDDERRRQEIAYREARGLFFRALEDLTACIGRLEVTD